MYGYIYLTTNLLNGKRYIGQRKHSTTEDSYLGSGKYLMPDIVKYGRHNFQKTILEVCDSKSQLNKAEIKWISKYNAVFDDNFYNIAIGGQAGDTWSGRTDAEKEKFKTTVRISNMTRKRNPENISGERNPAFGKHWYNDGKKNYLIYDIDTKQGYVKGLIRTPEHNHKISIANKGKPKSYASCLGKICVNKDKQNKFINPIDLDFFIAQGWQKGMFNPRWAQGGI